MITFKIGKNIVWIFLLLIAVLIINQPVQAGIDEWTTTTLANFGINGVAVDPTNPDTIYAATNSGL